MTKYLANWKKRGVAESVIVEEDGTEEDVMEFEMSILNVVFVDEDYAELILNINNLSKPNSLKQFPVDY